MELGLSSSPVWYQSRATDSFRGYFAFASRNVVYLLDITKDIPAYYGILSGHDAKINSCLFRHCEDEDQCLLASGSDDGSVKIWDIKTKQFILEHKIHGSNKITCLHWSSANMDLIISGDEKGMIVVWNLKAETTNKYFPETISLQQLTCVACSPHYSNLVVLGYKSGAASVVDISSKGKIIRKLRGHEQEIQSLTWSPFSSEDILQEENGSQEKNNLDVLITDEKRKMKGIVVTSSKDRTIRLWSFSSGKCLNICQLPPKSSKGRHANSDASKLYVALFWPKHSKTTFISSTYNGEILKWDVSTKSPVYQVIGGHCRDSGHQRIIFNITSGRDTNSVITTSMDRYIKHWTLNNDLAQVTPDWSLPTLGGFVYSIAVSPTDPSNVAVGVGDGIIRIWKTKNPRNPFDVLALWQGVKEKVMSMAWHPTREGILAYGTEDGKVGVYDTLSLKPPMIAATYHLKPVYSIGWGPICSTKENHRNDEDHLICLYSCGGEGIIFMHEHSKLKHGTDLNTIVHSTNEHLNHVSGKHSELSWMKNGNLLAVGNEDGSFHICRAPYLDFVTTYKVHNKIINCLAWCPVDSTHEQRYFIASGSNNSHVCINDVRNIAEKNFDEETDNTLPTPITQSYRTLSGHTGRITGLSWNSNNINQLVSSSYDGTAQVWDVMKEEPIANYRGHSGRVLCVIWSPILTNTNGQSGVVYSGGDDYSVHVWSPCNQENKEPPKSSPGINQKQNNQWKKKNKKKKSNTAHQAKNIPTPNEKLSLEKSENSNDLDFDIETLLERKKAELLEEMDLENQKNVAIQNSDHTFSNLNPNAKSWNENQNQPENIDSSTLKELLDNLSQTRQSDLSTKDEAITPQHRRKRAKNLFPLSISIDNKKKEGLQQDCIEIVKSKTQNVSRDDLGFYGNRVSAYRMLEKEEKRTLEDENSDANATLKLWSGDIIGMLENAIERGELTDQMVAMTPLAGHDVWQHACLSFSEQLAKDGHHLHASQYLLCCNKVKEAIVLLREAKLHREAVALSRARLADDDPLLIETCCQWARKLKYGGSFEMAAKCFASIGDYAIAAECLATRALLKPCLGKDEYAGLYAAATVARLGGEHATAREYTNRVITSVVLRTGLWKEAQEAAMLFESEFITLRLVLCTNEILWCVVTSRGDEFRLRDVYSDVTTWLNDVNYEENFKSILEKQFQKHFFEFGEFKNLIQIWNELELISNESGLNTTSISASKLTLKQVFYQISIQLTQLIAIFHLNDKINLENADLKNTVPSIVSCYTKHFNDVEQLINLSQFEETTQMCLKTILQEFLNFSPNEVKG